MANKSVSDKEQKDVLRSLCKIFGDGYDQRGFADSNAQAIPTGHDDLDEWLVEGNSGVYLGGVIELMGSEGSGKSSLALRTVGNAQKLGHLCCWIDAEAAFSPALARINGCDPTKLVMPQLVNTKANTDDEDSEFGLFNANEILDMIYKSVISNIFGLIVLDSVAGLMSPLSVDPNADPNKESVGPIPRAMSKALAKIALSCQKTKTSVIFINQLREKIGEYFPNRFHTPGGRALKFFAHQRIGVEKRLGKEGKVYSPDENGHQEVIGHYSRITIVKNRLAPPPPDGMSIDVPIYYKEYFPDDAQKCYQLARSLQVISMRNGILTWKNDDTVILKEDGESIVLSKLREDKGLLQQLAKDCVIASASDKNTSKKVPVKVSKAIEAIAESGKEESKNETSDSKSKKKNKSSARLTLDV